MLWYLIIGVLLLIFLFNIPCPTDGIDHIADQIYVSNWDAAANEHLLRKYGIKRVICLNTRKKTDSCRSLYDRLKIEHHEIQLEDHPSAPIKLILPMCYKLLQKDSEPTLVHCTAGVSRSAAVVAMYLMVSRGIDFDTAYKELKRCRPIVDINHGFREQLRAMTRSAFTSTTPIRAPRERF